MKTVENIIREMDDASIFTERNMTFNEYTDTLLKFQNLVTKMVLGEEYVEGMRLDEAIFWLEKDAREKKLDRNPMVRRGIVSLKKVEKELAISISGKKGEELVARTLEFINRPNTTIFRNVYVTNGESETELDSVVLTDAGIIILEIKKVKDDVTLTEDGRLFHYGDESYDKIPLGTKMQIKRELLNDELTALIKQKGMDIPLYIDSYIVLSTPKGVHINVNDRYGKEKFCFRTGINMKIDNYVGRASYDCEQLQMLGELLKEAETNVKRFENPVNFSEVRNDLAYAIMTLQNVPETEKLIINNMKDLQAKEIEKTSNSAKPHMPESVKKMYRRSGASRYSAVVGVFAGVVIFGAAAALGASLGRA